MTISKSKYIKGLQCHKALWLDKHKPELKADVSTQTQQNFATGNQVGDLAKGLFAGGEEIEFDGQNFPVMISKTKQLIDKDLSAIYEATFSENGVFAMVDILVKNGDRWDIYEVKSSTSVKAVYLDDVSVQRYALSAVLNVGQCYVVHINNKYIRQGGLDTQQLFSVIDVTDRLKSIDEVADKLQQMQQMLGSDEPNIDIGPQCDSPYACDFKSHCWAHIPKPSVFNLHRLNTDKKFAYGRQGKLNYKDLQNEPLSATQKMQISGKEFIDTKVIGKFINNAKFPLNFFDFETFQNAIPRFDNQRPYQQMPFQYSLHILAQDGSLTHQEFLGDEHTDPRANLIQQMLKDISTTGTIIAFNQSFEKGVIKNLAHFSPDNAAALLALRKRFMDLLAPFRGLGYYHPDFNGSFSIKSVLPAMFPNDDELDYKKLGQVQNGGDAMQIFANLHLEKDPKKVQQIKVDLLKYCHLDTLAMVRIWQMLVEKIS